MKKIRWASLIIWGNLVSNSDKQEKLIYIFIAVFAIPKGTKYVFCLLVQRLKLANLLNQFNIESKDLSGFNKSSYK